jgi:multiple sugar transport system substrate-binding protein
MSSSYDKRNGMKLGRAMTRREAMKAGLVLAGGSALAACGLGGTSPASSPASSKQNFSGITLNVACNPTSIGPATMGGKQWAAKTGATVNATLVPFAERALDFANAIVSQDPHFDLFFASKDFVAKFSDRLYVNLSSLHLDLSDFFPSTLPQLSRGGKLWALPLFADQELFIYNKADYAAAGADPNNPPNTWDGLYALAPKLNVGTREACVTTWQTEPLFWLCYYNSTGAPFLGQDGMQVLFDNQHGLDTWMSIAAAFKAKWYGPAGFYSVGDADTALLFNQNLGATQIGLVEWWSEAISGDVKNYNATINKSDVGVALMPGLTPGTHGSVIVTEGWGISKFSKHQDAALAFLQYMTGPDFQKQLNLGQVTGGILATSRVSVAKDPTVAASFPIGPILAEQAKLQEQWPGVPYPIGPIFTEAATQLFKGNWTAQQAHDNTVKATKAAIAKYLSS